MSDIVKIDHMPSVMRPVEGVDYSVIAGSPQTGDAVRITTGSGVQIFEGTYTPPAAPVSSVPSILSASGFQDACEAGLGGGSVGATRFGTITRAMDASADDLVFALNTRFVKSITFDKTKAASLFGILVAKGMMSAGERVAILAAWPAV